MPRSRPSASARAAGRGRPSRPARPRGRSSRRAALDGVRLAADLVDVGVVSPPQLERVDPELRRQLVDRLLQTGRALHHAGRAERVGRRQVDLEREQQRRARCRSGRASSPGVSTGMRGASRADLATSASASIAVELPSRVAPRRTLCRVAARRPPTSCSAWRSLTTRTGRRVSRDSAVAQQRLGPGALLAAEAAAHVLGAPAPARARCRSAGELVAGREHALRRDPRRQLVRPATRRPRRAARAASAGGPASPGRTRCTRRRGPARRHVAPRPPRGSPRKRCSR